MKRQEEVRLGIGCGCLIIVALICFFLIRGCGPSDNNVEVKDPVPHELKLTPRPNDFNPELKRIEEYVHDDRTGVGSSKFMILSPIEGGRYSLHAFTQDCSIADLCWMMTQVYNEYLSPRITRGETLSSYDHALLEMALMSHFAYVVVAYAQFSNGILAKRPKEYENVNMFDGSRWWGKDASDMINTLVLKWREFPMGMRALECGWHFSACNKEWVISLYRRIENEEGMDIRWPNLYPDTRNWVEKLFGTKSPRYALFDFNDAVKYSEAWKEVQTVVFNESVMVLQRMNKEITEALSRVSDVKGYPELHEAIETWRPVIKEHVKQYCIAYSDLSLAILSKAAYDLTTTADHTFSTDRPFVKAIASQFTRAISDGQMQRFSVSATSGSLISQYHGYLRKLLGEDDYQHFKNSIRWRKSDPLRLE